VVKKRVAGGIEAMSCMGENTAIDCETQQEKVFLYGCVQAGFQCRVVIGWVGADAEYSAHVLGSFKPGQIRLYSFVAHDHVRV